MTDSNGRNSNDTTGPSGIGTAPPRPAGTTGGVGSTGSIGVASTAGAATAPKPRRAAPAKAAATSAGPGATPRSTGSGQGSAKTTVRDEANKLKNEATTKARDFATQGKDKATSALDGLADMLKETATEVDERMGEQYGRYARSAADSVASFSSTIRGKEVDELLGDARDLVRKSPAVAIGAAAAVGFVLARLIKSGMEPTGDENRTADRPRTDFDDGPRA